MYKDLKNGSRETFEFKNYTLENINTGCLQRIADSLEKIEKPYQQLIEDYNYLKKRNQSLQQQKTDLENRVRALKGVITKLKKKEVGNAT